jgi:hypothetical protein
VLLAFDIGVKMKREGADFSCEYCEEKVECLPGEALCQVLGGWLIVAHWKGPGSVEHHNFCSFSCLQKWVNSQVTEVPEVFIKYLEENEN